MILKYPDNFDTPTFPAGPRIALSRVMAIAIMVVFALIIVAGGMILWASRSPLVEEQQRAKKTDLLPFTAKLDSFQLRASP